MTTNKGPWYKWTSNHVFHVNFAFDHIEVIKLQCNLETARHIYIIIFIEWKQKQFQVNNNNNQNAKQKQPQRRRQRNEVNQMNKKKKSHKRTPVASRYNHIKHEEVQDRNIKITNINLWL